MKKTLREIHEEAAGMGLDKGFFIFNGIDPEEMVEVKEFTEVRDREE